MIPELVVVLGIAGLVVLLWPAQKSTASTPLAATLVGQSQPSPTTTQTFQSAMLSLSAVRSRLLVTDHLDEKVKLAIETITHALVDASDK